MADTLGKRIAELRKKNGITQDQLAEEMGVSGQAVSKWENDISCPDISALPKLADYFHVTVDELLRGEQDRAVALLPEETRKDISQMVFRVNIVDGGDIVKINLPLVLFQAAQNAGLSPNEVININGMNINGLKGIDFATALAMANLGVVGKLVEIDGEDGEHVEIYVE